MSTITEGPPQQVTMEQVGVTLGFSVACLCGTLFAFAIAIRCQSTNIAPRCEARPREVIYNPNPDADPSQKRGNPFLLGWVWWVLGLTYDVVLKGVPGTGTRKLGLKGDLLSCNLDHLVLLRFNALCLKIATATTIVYCAVCLPIYFYSRCDEVPLGDFNATELDYPGCNELLSNSTVFSSYSRFTLANVPNANPETYFTEDYLSEGYNAARLIVVALSTCLVCWYVCFELFHEWVDMVAIRRVYYLENDLWKRRKAQLKATMLSTPRHKNEDDVLQESHIYEREAWIPHPEQRDTPPNIELYSVLVGGIPSKPEDAINSDDLEAALKAGDDDLDWQMNVVSAFFDSCVPNQPGYTSSVAALTILPSATDLAIAWKAWSGLGKLLSRLRFIRRRIIELGHTPGNQTLSDGMPGKQDKHGNQNGESLFGFNDHNDSIYEADRRKEYSAEILGAGINDDVNDEFWKSLDLGPEQVAVYNQEMSKSVAGCCPHGFCQEQISYCSDINTLRDMEEEAAEEVKEAYLELKRAGESATTHTKKRAHLLKLDKLDKMLDKMLIDSSDKLERHQSTTELQLLRRRSLHSAKKNGPRRAQSALPLRNLEREGSEASFETARSHLERPRGLDAGLMRLASVRPRNSFVDPDYPSAEPDLWSTVETIAGESKNLNRKVATKYKVSNGRWHIPTLKRGLRGFRNKLSSILLWTNDNSKSATDVMARDSSFAIVTFTSRQSAIAARKCLADGRGAKSFEAIDSLPVPPLADSAAFNICDCRGFTRPVTIGLNDHQKNWRKIAMVGMLAAIYVFFTSAVTATSTRGTEVVTLLFPSVDEHRDRITGLVDSVILSSFLALLPDTFLWLANFGSNATSLVEAENSALGYYWNFMYIYAIIGSSIARMVLGAYQNGSVDFYENMATVAKTIPVQISYTWLNWIILKSGVFHPLFYLLQSNTWLSSMFGLKCCARLFRGGGAGNRLPYRIYVESGTVILCALALAPQAPIVAPFALLFFTICAPLKRWVVIFTYRPAFDSGGSRWPLLFDMIITSIVVGQLLLSAVLLFKNSYAPGIIALLPVLAIYMFRRMVLKRFLEAFQDAALLQTSMLDGWDVGPESEHLSYRGREEFRQFLVDAHKASYVPVCVAAVSQLSSNQITAEPALVQALPNDEPVSSGPSISKGKSVRDMREAFRKERTTRQFGALNRRRLISIRNLSITSDDSRDGDDDPTEMAPLRRDFPRPAAATVESDSASRDSDPTPEDRPLARTRVLGRVFETTTSSEGMEHVIDSSEGNGEWNA